jgi:hypothetical protein
VTQKIDIRLIAATHKNLEDLIQKGEFREDLYYRLNVIPITTPPLRQHPEDIPELVDYFSTGFSNELKLPLKEFLPEISTPKNNLGTIDLSKEYGFNRIFDLNENPEFEDYKKPDEINEFLSKSQSRNELLNTTPDLVLNSQETEMITILEEELNIYVADMKMKFIKGESDIEDEWTEYVNECDIRGYKAIEEIWKNAWSTQR